MATLLELRRFFADQGLVCIASLREEGRTDFAFLLATRKLALVSFVDEPKRRDQAALETMVAEGDFVWGGLVHRNEGALEARSPIETFRETELDRVVARLLELQEVAL